MSNRPLKPQVPGEGPDAPGAPATTETQPAAAAPAPKPVEPTPPLQPAAKTLPDQSEVDPAAIPYGQTVMTKQGLVCSTQERKVPGPR